MHKFLKRTYVLNEVSRTGLATPFLASNATLFLGLLRPLSIGRNDWMK